MLLSSAIQYKHNGNSNYAISIQNLAQIIFLKNEDEQNVHNSLSFHCQRIIKIKVNQKKRQIKFFFILFTVTNSVLLSCDEQSDATAVKQDKHCSSLE